MIHYILLPAEERHALRREYRLRLAIITFFFVSCAMVLGIASLLPAYFYSAEQEKEAAVREEVLERSRIESGADQVEKELIVTQAIAEKINAEKDPVAYGDVLQKIIGHKEKGISLNFFSLTQQLSTTTLAGVTIVGKAETREALLEFKKSLESDKSFLEVDLPLSGLAKSTDLDFDLRLKVARPKK